MKYCTPEQAGISSKHVRRFYKALDDFNLSTHSVIMARGDSIFTECYYAPFDRNFLHRMYSVSKTFVAIAMGFCVQDGLLSLDDPISKFLGDYINKEGAVQHKTTVRELLTMETDIVKDFWFNKECTDRTDVYFKAQPTKLPGTLFDYDSSGTFIAGVIIERLTGKPFLKYLQEKVLDDIGFSKDAYCIKAPGGHSFSDSGVMCTAYDLLLFARFILNGGTWNGKRYLNEEYIKEATAMKVCNSDYGFNEHGTFGYGYYIWGAPRGCFAMLGMGNQVALGDPAHDFVFIINSDNQGSSVSYEQIFVSLYDHIIDNLSDNGEALPEDPKAYGELLEYTKDKKLFCLDRAKTSPFADKINGVTFIPHQNPMGIKWFKLELSGDTGVFHYENQQGVKEMPFGFGFNVFDKFPQDGYSDLTAKIPCPGNKYRAAFSADWPEEQKLRIRVQIIDKYFANLAIIFGFKDENNVSVRMTKRAEDFLKEYDGVMIALREQ